MGLRCFSRWSIGMYGSTFFIGRLTGNLFLAKFGDSIGRIELLRYSLAMSILCYGSIIFIIRNKIILYAPIFIYGLISCWRCNLSYIYGLEVIESRFQNLIGSYFQVADSITLLFSTFFYICIINNWTHLHFTFLTILCYCLIVFCYLPESPKFLNE